MITIRSRKNSIGDYVCPIQYTPCWLGHIASAANWPSAKYEAIKVVPIAPHANSLGAAVEGFGLRV